MALMNFLITLPALDSSKCICAAGIYSRAGCILLARHKSFRYLKQGFKRNFCVIFKTSVKASGLPPLEMAPGPLPQLLP